MKKFEIQKQIINSLRGIPKKCLSINQLRKKIGANWSTTQKYLRQLEILKIIIPIEKKVIVGYSISPDFDTTFFDYIENINKNKLRCLSNHGIQNQEKKE